MNIEKKFKRSVDTIVIYVTSPIMKVLGEVELLDTRIDSPLNIWTETSKKGGINKKAFDLYFKGKNKAVAYVLGKAKDV